MICKMILVKIAVQFAMLIFRTVKEQYKNADIHFAIAALMIGYTNNRIAPYVKSKQKFLSKLFKENCKRK